MAISIREQADQIKAQHDLRFVFPRTPKRTLNGNIVMDCCPFHDDTTPSLRIYSSYYKCYACPAKGDFFDFCKATRGWNFLQVVEHHTELPMHAYELETYNPDNALKPAKVFPSSMALSYHFGCTQNVLDYYLYKGLTRPTIIRFKLGFGVHPQDEHSLDEQIPNQQKVFTIPLFEEGKLCGMKFRRNDCCPKCWCPKTDIEKVEIMDEKVEFATCTRCQHEWTILGPKYRSLTGQRTFLWGYADIPDDYDDTVFIVEGEIDRMVMWQHGFHCITSTGGAMSWKKIFANKLTKRFRRVIALTDQDDAGRAGAEHIRSIMPELRIFTEWREGKDVSDVSRVVGDLKAWMRHQDRLVA